MTCDLPPILLDVSRLVSRLGAGPLTGIDRVEAEWLRHLSRTPHLLLCRVPRADLLLPPEAGPRILRWLGGEVSDLQSAGWIDRLRNRGGLPERAAQALRDMALAQATIPRLRDMAVERLGAGCIYLNLGHANWRREVFGGLSPMKRVVMIHDTIPLDHPEFTRQGQSDKFRDRFMNVTAMSDLILTVSDDSRDHIALWRGKLAVQKRAPIAVVPIGTRIGASVPADLPAGLDLSRPYFVTLGTIEPRKNHGLLLDIWDRLREGGGAVPDLYIVGRRGWENRDVFARLDALPAGGPVRELNGLSDGAVAALLDGARALLMPSRAEGFGLPLTEAAARGLPVLTAPLPSAKALLGEGASYIDPYDGAGWEAAIRTLNETPVQRLTPLPVPNWDDHFKNAANTLRDLAL